MRFFAASDQVKAAEKDEGIGPGMTSEEAGHDGGQGERTTKNAIFAEL